MKYIWKMKVIEVEEKFRQDNFRKDDQGKHVFDNVSTGWWVTTHNMISHPVGPTKPDISVGDAVIITMEKRT